MIDIILNWIDLIWLPVIFFCVDKKHRWLGVGFVIACMMMLRMQYELIEAVGFGDKGALGLMDSPPFIRGQITYSIFIALFILLSIFSRQAMKSVYLAASITIFFTAFIISTIIMAL